MIWMRRSGWVIELQSWDGEFVQIGRPDEIILSPVNDYVEAFVGCVPSQNTFGNQCETIEQYKEATHLENFHVVQTVASMS